MMTYLLILCLYLVHNIGILFFFKKKTAYHMRISDWSSDVCSSDLDHLCRPFGEPGTGLIGPRPVVRVRRRPGKSRVPRDRTRGGPRPLPLSLTRSDHALTRRRPRHHRRTLPGRGGGPADAPLPDRRLRARDHRPPRHLRSEEHTSELQSLMRLSYAVFCLHKKKQHNQQTT